MTTTLDSSVDPHRSASLCPAEAWTTPASPLMNVGDARAPTQAEMHELGATWHALVQGKLVMTGQSMSGEGLELRLIEGKSGPLSARQRSLLDQTIGLPTRKSFGIEKGLSESTISAALQRALRHLGLCCIPSRVPLLIVVAATAARERSSVTGLSWRERGDETVVLLRGPGPWLSKRLTPSQTHVALLRLAGSSLLEIAARRETSERTVANQLAAAYHKLDVSGRAGLMHLLAKEYGHGRIPA